MIAIYRAAKRAGIKIKHRFVSNHTAVLVSGPHGELVTNDLVDGTLIEDEVNPLPGWTKFMREVEKIPGCWKRELGKTSDNDGPTVF